MKFLMFIALILFIQLYGAVEGQVPLNSTISVGLGDEFEGNDRYEGFLIDMLERIAEKVGFEYELSLPSDGYGTIEK